MAFMAIKKKQHRFKKAVIAAEDISCSACALRIEESVSKMGGVDSVTVHVATKTIIIKYDEDAVTINRLQNKIKDLGYTPSAVFENYLNVSSVSESMVKSESSSYFFRFLISAFVSAVLFFDFDFANFTLFIMAGFSWLYGGWHFHKGFYYSLKNKSADMNTLVSLSSSVMFLYISFFVFFPEASHFGGHFFHWHEIPMLLAFINLGKFLEAKSRHNAGKAVRELNSLFPKFALKQDEKGSVLEIKASDIVKGDIIIVKPGAQTPVDGTIIEGSSHFDLRFLTGESEPVLKKEGDFLYAGSVNFSGAVKMRAEKVGSEMMLAKLAALINEAQGVKINIQKTVDKISSYFVPAVIFLAFFSGFLWLREGLDFAVNSFASVLAVSCPCAMGLSVPLAVMLGYTRALKLGFAINNPAVLENFSKIDTVLLDKTGTLTQGKMSLTEIKPINISENDFLKYLFTVENNSEHVFSAAVRNYCLAKNIEPLKAENFISFPGLGISADINGEKVMAGSPDFMNKNGIDFSAHSLEIEKAVGSVIILAKNKTYLGYALLEDKLRDNAKELVDDFIKAGIKPIIVSGDRKNAVEKIARILGIEEYYYGVKPDEKHSAVLKYKSFGRHVLMIGDGINDSAALNEADIGVAMRGSSDLTSSVSDMVLLKEDISLILKVISLSDKIKKIIKQNLFWAFSYNALLIPIAAGILYPINGFLMKPYMAALVMGLSSVSVVFNSLRLLKMKV
ncbi:MAG: cation-translocating P-type ATPase [Elusimicrobiota bacterium]